MKNLPLRARLARRKRKNTYAEKHSLQLKGIFNESSPLPDYRLKEFKLSNGTIVKLKCC